ncbi:metallophosphoesterase family protein [Singulisphaera sp. GP187]|uniref:metallophosphoesterase family protein n=1 Tax=Singulisphaera sp. GP187 TaxID=1882752 RepID=UPI000940ACCF|nr:metallophosphoesterase [Singulisphaera sp. GP187]
MRIIHLSDIHVWRYAFNPLRLLNKRAVGMFSLLAGRAGRFRLERLHEVVTRVVGLAPDHVLITGDLSTTALADEFREARSALAELLLDSTRVTVIPGNHDRYTTGSVRYRLFEEWFGMFSPPGPYPWLRPLDDETAILGLDATRSHLSARGYLPTEQLDRARALTGGSTALPKRLIVACHYPVVAPAPYAVELEPKRMTNAVEVSDWLATIGRHLYCCGHVHAAWAFVPEALPDQLCLNAGAPLLRDPTGHRPPGFLQIELEGNEVTTIHHAWTGHEWSTRLLSQTPDFFRAQLHPTPVQDDLCNRLRRAES